MCVTYQISGLGNELTYRLKECPVQLNDKIVFAFTLFCYLCHAMRKKFGDWLLDIAKYMATAILLTSVFDEIRESWISYVSVSIAIILSLIVGLILTKDAKREDK